LRREGGGDQEERGEEKKFSGHKEMVEGEEGRVNCEWCVSKPGRLGNMDNREIERMTGRVENLREGER